MKHLTALMTVYMRVSDWDAVDKIWLEIVKGQWDGKGMLKDHVSGEVSEAAACTYLDSLGFRGDLSGLEFTWNIFQAVENGLQSQRGSFLENDNSRKWAQNLTRHVITENQCNSYVEALIRCRKFLEAISFTCGMGRKPWEHVGVPTAKTIMTIVSGLKSKGKIELARDFLFIARGWESSFSEAKKRNVSVPTSWFEEAEEDH
jgi:hypothetical protein